MLLKFTGQRWNIWFGLLPTLLDVEAFWTFNDVDWLVPGWLKALDIPQSSHSALLNFYLLNVL